MHYEIQYTGFKNSEFFPNVGDYGVFSSGKKWISIDPIGGYEKGRVVAGFIDLSEVASYVRNPQALINLVKGGMGNIGAIKSFIHTRERSTEFIGFLKSIGAYR